MQLKTAISGAAIDVFPDEPEKSGDKFVSVLQNLSNVILTPHIGGSTEEAQVNIVLDVTSKLIGYLEELGVSDDLLIVPSVHLPLQTENHNILHIQEKIPSFLLEQYSGDNPVRIERR